MFPSAVLCFHPFPKIDLPVDLSGIPVKKRKLIQLISEKWSSDYEII